VPGGSAVTPCRVVKDRLAAGGLRSRSPKIGYATGLTIRERPILRPDETIPLKPGAFFAFDFATHPESTRSGYHIHVEDRVLLTDDGPTRISDTIDTRQPMPLDL